MTNVMTNDFTELTNNELISIDGGGIDFDVNKFIDQCAKYGRKWWNFWEEKGEEVYDVFGPIFG